MNKKGKDSPHRAGRYVARPCSYQLQPQDFVGFVVSCFLQGLNPGIEFRVLTSVDVAVFLNCQRHKGAIEATTLFVESRPPER